MCPYGRYEKRRIICTVDEEPCMHVGWCDIKVKWLQTDSYINCPNKEKEDEQRSNAEKNI